MSKKLVSLFLAVLFLFSAATVMAEGNAITVTDMAGREVVIEGPVTRIITMQPSDCEILYAIGCGNALVGRGEYCDYPAEALDAPAVQSGANTNLEEILALQPQVVIMTDMNNTPEIVELLQQNGIAVIETDADSIEEVYVSIRLLGQIMGKEAEAEAVVADMQATFADIAAKSVQREQTIYFEISPLQWGLYSAGTGTFMHELAEMCGLKNIFGDAEGYLAVSEEQVLERNPDYIVLMNGMGETSVEEVMGRENWGEVAAVKNGAVYNDINSIMTRPAPRLKDAAIELYNFINGITEAEAEPAA